MYRFVTTRSLAGSNWMLFLVAGACSPAADVEPGFRDDTGAEIPVLRDTYAAEVVDSENLSAVAFTNTWNHSATPDIVSGGNIALHYDSARLGRCRATYAAGRAWNIIASWTFHPGGQHGEIALFQGDYYADDPQPLVPLIGVPADASRVEFYFHNTDRAGCSEWDSNMGRNFEFDVVPAGLHETRVGWMGGYDFVMVDGTGSRTHHGDADPAYYWNRMAGVPSNSWLEVQVWIPGLTDQLSHPPTALAAQAFTNALPNDEPDADTWRGTPLRFLRRDGNNFVYAFEFSRLRWNTFTQPPIPDGLYEYVYRFSTDAGATWQEFEGSRTRRFVVADELACELFPDHAPRTCPQPTAVDWAGAWGGRFNHSCEHVAVVPNPVTFTKSALGHDCMVIDAEVYVAGLTDADIGADWGAGSAIVAEVETDIGFDGGPLETPITYPLQRDGTIGNNFRFAWNVQEHIGRAARGDYSYRFRFSADRGLTWTYLGDSEGEFMNLLLRDDSLDTDPVCEGYEQWHSAFQHIPVCVENPPTEHINVQSSNATSPCTLFVEGFGRGQWSHNSSHARWSEAYLRVQGSVQRTGMMTLYYDTAPSAPSVRYSLGTEIEPGLWKTGFTYAENGSYDFGSSTQLLHFAFFADTERDGAVTRHWLSARGDNYDFDTIFSPTGNTVSTSVDGSVEYAVRASPIFEHRWFCQ